MYVWPVYVMPATFLIESFVGGMLSVPCAGLNVPTKFGLAAPFAVQPGAGFDVSIESAFERPNVGDPVIRKRSFVCAGPLIVSPVAKLMSVQLQERPSRT